MNVKTMNARISDLIDGIPTKFKKGGEHQLISTKQESQLFNTLHREYDIQSMSIINNGGNERRILAYTWDKKVLIDSTFFVY
jgi:hypothetical protein